MPADDFAVHRDVIPLPRQHDVANLQFGNGHHGLRTVRADERRRRRRQTDEFFDFTARAFFGKSFQPFAERNERQNHARRLEIEHGVFPFGREEPKDDEHRTVNIGHRRTETDERIHVGHALDERAGPDREETEIHRDDRRGQHPLHDRTNGIGRLRQTDHMSHGEVHQYEQYDGRNNETDQKRPVLPLFRLHGGGALFIDTVPQRAHGGKNLLSGNERFVVFDLHALPHQGDADRRNALHFSERMLDTARARRTGHAADGKFLVFHCKILLASHTLTARTQQPRTNRARHARPACPLVASKYY